jgi:hypothetical protein
MRPLQPSITAEDKMSFSRAIQRQLNENTYRQNHDIASSIRDPKSTHDEQSKERLHELSDDDQYDDNVFLDYVPIPKNIITQKAVEPKQNSKGKRVSISWNVPKVINPVSKIQERVPDAVEKSRSASIVSLIADAGKVVEISGDPVSKIQERVPDAVEESRSASIVSLIADAGKVVEISGDPVSKIQERVPDAVEESRSASIVSLIADAGKVVEISGDPVTSPQKRVVHSVSIIEARMKQSAAIKILPEERQIETLQEKFEELEEISISVEEERSLEIDRIQGDQNDMQLSFREEMAAAARCARMKWEEDIIRALELESLSRKREEEEAEEMRCLALQQEKELVLLHEAECDRQLREFDAMQKREEQKRLARDLEEQERTMMQIEDEQRHYSELLRQLGNQKRVYEQEKLLVEVLEERRQGTLSQYIRTTKYILKIKTHNILSSIPVDEFSTLNRERLVYDTGDIYEGFIDDQGKPHGAGSMVYSNGDSYEGEFVHGLRDGWGVHIQELPKTVYQGYQSAGRRCSFGVIEHADGYIYKGAWLNDKMHGEGEEIWPDGEEYFGNYHLGIKQGYGVYKYASGHVYEGEFSVDKKHGVGICTWPNGDVYSGEYKAGLRHGKGSYVSVSGWVYTGDWWNDFEHGMGKQIYVRSGRVIFNGKWSKGNPCLRR